MNQNATQDDTALHLAQIAATIIGSKAIDGDDSTIAGAIRAAAKLLDAAKFASPYFISKPLQNDYDCGLRHWQSRNNGIREDKKRRKLQWPVGEDENGDPTPRDEISYQEALPLLLPNDRKAKREQIMTQFLRSYKLGDRDFLREKKKNGFTRDEAEKIYMSLPGWRKQRQSKINSRNRRARATAQKV